jgi:hypothetical protein
MRNIFFSELSKKNLKNNKKLTEQSILIKYGQISRERIRKMKNRQKQNKRIMEFYETQSIVNFCDI